MAMHVPEPILDQVAPLIVGGSLGALFGWLIGSPYHSSLLWPIGFSVVLVASSVGWYRRSLKIEEKDSRKEERDETDSRTLHEMNRKIDIAVGSDGRWLTRSNGSPIVNAGDTVTVMGHSTIVKTPGVGPVTVTVPSGGLFGIDPDQKLTFTIPANVGSFNLPKGGTVAAQLSRQINSVSEVKGQPTIQRTDEDEGRSGA
jgi:uncharacterized membrane protein YfcA